MRERQSILLRLTLVVLVAAIIPSSLLIGILLQTGRTAQVEKERQIEATLDLSINLEMSLLKARLDRMRDQALGLAAHPEIAGALLGGPSASTALNGAQSTFVDTDLITLVDGNGLVQARVTAGETGDTLSYGGLIDQVLQTGTAVASYERIGKAELEAEGLTIVNQARLPVLATEGAQDGRVGTELQDGLVLLAVVPVRGPSLDVIGAVIVGDLLNNDNAIVDAVATRSPLGIPLNATIALDGIRITTNVPAPGGERRAIGTQYSDPVMERLRAGQEYRGRALVGGWQWQRTIYIPMHNYAGKVVAGAYVGVPESYFTTTFTQVRNSIWGGVIAVTLFAALITIFSFMVVKHWLLRPLLLVTQSLMVAPNFPRYITKRNDEIGDLAGAVNDLIERVRKRAGVVSRASATVGATAARLASVAQAASGSAKIAADEINSALVAADQAGRAAQTAAGRARELERALARVTAGAEEQARATQHVSTVSAEVSVALRQSREVMTSVLVASREALVQAQQGRQDVLRTLTALESVRMAADGALKQGETTNGSGRVDKVISTLEQGRLLATGVDESLRRIAIAAEEALNRLWELSAVLNENGARVAAIAQHMGDVVTVVVAARHTTRGTAQTSQQVMGEVESLAARTDEAIARLRQAQDRVMILVDTSDSSGCLTAEVEEIGIELERVALLLDLPHT